MIGVVVPAHEEEEVIGACLQSLRRAACCPGLKGEQVMMIVSLDSCTDATGTIARGMGATTVDVRARNVGKARAHGAQVALDAGARWLAFTDADSTVASDWFTVQLAQGTDAVCGTVTVQDWGSYDECLRQQHHETYTDRDGHRHVHGANLGVSAHAYRLAGGFRPLKSSEDVDLVRSLHNSGASISWTAAPRVVTSARRNFRAPGGFGAALERVALTHAATPMQGAS